MMKRLFPFLALAFIACACTTPQERAAAELAGRIVPEYASRIDFRQIKSDTDSYEIYSSAGKLVVCGNNANSMAVGLNRYLRECCHSQVSWMADEPVTVPSEMPVLDHRISGSAVVDSRFFLNYCTYGYTMPYWKWNEWERLIDWMALNGITMAFSTTGQESVWMEVWKELGLSEEQILDYFTGPAHLPWHRLDNLDSFQGRLPESWLDGQVELQKQIVERERELGITPVAQVFSGHVPEALKTVCPDAKIHPLSQIGSDWGGMDAAKYGAWFLETTDPLFEKIQKSFIEKYTALFGCDHVYGADPFNEVDSPDWSPEFLASVSKGIYETMKKADPQAVWLQMTWLFYADQNHWNAENVKAYLTAVPEGGMTLLDYYCDAVELWKQTESFYGQPYIWCLLENFGGNTALIGNYGDIKAKLDNVLLGGGSNLAGIGATLEALDCNQWLFEYVFDRAWKTSSAVDPVIMTADYMLGREDELWREAWTELVNRIYAYAPNGGRQGSCLTVRPTAISNARARYSNLTLINIWKKMLEVEPSDADAYKFTLVNVGRQVLGNHFDDLYDDYLNARSAGDAKAMKAILEQMLELADDIDLLLAQHPYFSFGKWCDMARDWGTSEEEADYYEINARTLLTTWGTRDVALADYANHAWSSLVASFHKHRWEMYFNGSTDSDIADFEIAFASSTEPLKRVGQGDAVWICKDLCSKYFDNYQTRQPRYSDSFKSWANTYRYEGIVGACKTRPNAIFIGDSITEGWAVHPDFFISRGCLFIGISGQTSSQILQRMRSDVLPLLPKKVIILCGTNDIAGNDAPYNETLVVCNIRTMCELAREKGIEPIVCSVTPSNYFFWNSSSGDPSAKIKALNKRIKAYAASAGIRYVDYHSALDNGAGALKTEYSKDGCHLTEAGYNKMEQIVTNYL